MTNKTNILKWVSGTSWSIIAIALLVLLISASRKKEQKICSNIEVNIQSENEQKYLSNSDVENLINTVGNVRLMPISQINIRLFEEALIKNPWIKSVNIYFDNQQTLHVDIQENRPFVRIFTINSVSFYFDQEGVKLPLSDKMNLRMPIVTGFTSDNEILSKPDSLLKEDVLKLVEFIRSDSFWFAQTSQINITENRKFEWVPLIGKHIVELGDISNLKEKFDKLYSYYKNVWAKTSSEEYAVLKLQYKNQIVAVKRGNENSVITQNEIPSDSTITTISEKTIQNKKENKDNTIEEKLKKQPKAILKNKN